MSNVSGCYRCFFWGDVKCTLAHALEFDCAVDDSLSVRVTLCAAGKLF